MIKEANALVAVRAELAQAEESLGVPGKLDQFSKVIEFLARSIYGPAPQIEKDIAKKLILRHRMNVLSEVKVILASTDSYELEFLAYWNKVMEIFVDARLADDPEFIACKEQLLERLDCTGYNGPRAADPATANQELQATNGREDSNSRIIKETRSMLHAKSLRGIGQSLERLRLQTFSLEKKGDYFLLRSESLTATHEWILRKELAETDSDARQAEPSTELTVGDGWLCYGPRDIARLNARQERPRDLRHFEPPQDADKLAQLLRTLGEHLDRKGATAFKISWTADSVSVDYQTPNEERERKDFTVAKLQQLASWARFRRPSRKASMGFR